MGNEKIKEKGALQLEKSIQDDYIKFFCYGENHIKCSGMGILGFVTSHGFLDNPFLRGMRYSTQTTFDQLFVLDLHGNVLRHEQSPDGSPDKNVFDIKRTGVAISLFRRILKSKPTTIYHADLWGDRDTYKYPWLNANTMQTSHMQHVESKSPFYLFIPQDSKGIEEYEWFFSIADIMPVYRKGVVTGRDAFVIDFDTETLLDRMRIFAESDENIDDLVKRFDLNPTEWWDVKKARREMHSINDFYKYVRPVLYRPFDKRVCFYHPSVFMSPRRPVMKNIDPGLHNYLLITSRMTKGEAFQHITVTNGLAEAILLSSKTSNNAIIFPLYLYPDNTSLDLALTRQPNFKKIFLKEIQTNIGLPIIDGHGDFRSNVGIEEILCYILAILHSPKYRIRYAEPLTRDFPRVPVTGSLELFKRLTKFGEELVAFHLMESPKLDKYFTRFVGKSAPEVEKVSYSDEVVWLDKAKTQGFQGVPENVWNFHIGGYQVCYKWLKDRKGRTLSADDINHYHRIIVALKETIRIMAEIDKVIEAHGGWPDAFLTKDEKAKSEYDVQPQPVPKAAEEILEYKKQKSSTTHPKVLPLKKDWKTWFALSQWAKQTTSINTFWGGFALEIVKALKEGKQLTDKQKIDMVKCWNQAIKNGFEGR